MAIADDFSIDAERNIRYTGTTTNYTVLEFHRWLQDLADDEIFANDDVLDITDLTPSERATDNIVRLINGFNIDDTAAQHLYDGSIEQSGGDVLYSGLVVVGAVESGTTIRIIQDNALLTDFWTGGGENADPANNVLLNIMVKTRDNGADIDGKRIRVQARELGDSYAEFGATLGFGTSTAALFTGPDLNNQTLEATISGWTITNVEALSLIDVDNDTVDEEYYSEWDRGAQSINDLYEYTKWTQRTGTSETLYGMVGELFRGITHSFAYDNEVGAAFAQNEVIAWGTSFAYDNEAGGPFTEGEYVSFSPSGAVGKLIYLDDAGATGNMIIQKETGTIADNDVITGLTSGATADVNGAVTGNSISGGTGAVLAIDDDGTTGNLYIQLLTGSAPADNVQITGRTSSTTADVNGAPTQRTISPEFIGVSTGSAIIGAYGIGIATSGLSNSDQLFDLTNTNRIPPNNVQFVVNGLVIGEDRVLVGPYDGSSDLDESQLIGATGSNASGAGTFVANAAIPTDTPATGTIRLFNGQSYDRVPYTSYTGSTFTLSGTLPNDVVSHALAYDNEASGPFTNGETLTFGGGGTAQLVRVVDDGATGTMYIRMLTGTVPADNETISGGTSSATADVNGAPTAGSGFVSYLDLLATATSESFTVVYDADRTLFVRVRDGGGTPIKTFETPATLGSNGGSTTAIRTTDL